MTLCDPDPEVERKVGEVLANADRAYAKLTMAPRGRRGSDRSPRRGAAVADADFVRRAPEREDLKIPLLADRPRRTAGCDHRVEHLGAPADPAAVGDGASRALHGRAPVQPGLSPAAGRDLRRREDQRETKERAAAFYERIGMQALHLRKEIDGFIADRLMEALWREALHLVNDDVATAEEIDDAIRFGCGLRWSFMGTFLVYRIAGGEQGMRHFMAQFGPALKLPWTKLEAPELTDALLDKIVAQSDAQAGAGRSASWSGCATTAWSRSCRACRRRTGGRPRSSSGTRRGSTTRASASRRSARRPRRTAAALPGPIPTDWVDYNGHVNESRYLQLFSDGSDALLRLIGLDQAYLARGFSWFTVETHIMHRARRTPATWSRSTDVGADEKRMHLFQTATAPATGPWSPPPSRCCSTSTPGPAAPARRARMRERLCASRRPRLGCPDRPTPAGTSASGGA